MSDIFIGYGFVQSNTDLVISKITRKTYKKYEKILHCFAKIQNLYCAYRNTSIQFNLINSFTRQYDLGKLKRDTLYQFEINSLTAYILMHRMFVDNCKSFYKKYPDANIQPLIQNLENKLSERNMKILRDYAMHTSIPMSEIGIKTNISFTNKINNTSLQIELKKDDMDIEYLSKFDKSVIEE